MDIREAITKWAKSFGEQAVRIVESQVPDEDGELFASFRLGASVEELAAHFGVSESEIEAEVIQKASSECLVALLAAGHSNVTVSVDGDVVVAVTEPISRGFELV